MHTQFNFTCRKKSENLVMNSIIPLHFLSWHQKSLDSFQNDGSTQRLEHSWSAKMKREIKFSPLITFYGLGPTGVLMWSKSHRGKVWTSWRKVEHAKQISWYLQAMSGNKFALELFSYWFLVSLSNRNLYRVSFNENQGMI